MFKGLVLLLAFFASFSVWAEYFVRLSPVALEQHLLRVEIETPKLQVGEHQLAMPIWRTGRYEQLDFAKAMAEFSAQGEDQQNLRLQVSADNRWQIHLKQPQTVTLSYLISANELAMRTRHLDESHLFLDFASAVVVVDGLEDQAYRIQFDDFPKSWRLRSGLRSPRKNELWSKDYQQLIDSPVEFGVHQIREFRVSGADFELIVWGDTPADLDKMSRDIKALVEASYGLWGEFPFERYVFMLHATSGVRGGTEHLNSTIMQWDRFKLNDEENYLNYLGLVAHEFVHSWNVKAYRPAAYVPYDLTQRASSPLLWLAEGSTSYLQEKLLLKAGLMTDKAYFKRLSKRMKRHQNKPGGQAQSVAEASQTKWVQGRDNHQHNFFANIYDEGFLVTWLMDLWLLEHSEQARGVGALHQYLYQHHSLPNGLTESQLITAMGRLTGTSLEAKQWWQETVQSELIFEPEQLLEMLGLSLEQKKDKVSLDATYQVSAEGVQIARVNRDGAAWRAGLAPGDQIIAIDGFAANQSTFELMQHSWKAEQRLTLALFRQGKLIERQLELATTPSELSIEVDEKASKQAMELRKAWLENR